MMTEKNQVMSLETLLAGTPLHAFLLELASIKDEEIVETETKTVQEGEIVLGEMTPFERRLNFWYDRRKEKLNAELKERFGKVQLLDAGSVNKMMEEMNKFAEFDQETEARFKLFAESIRGRFPDAKGIALRAGYVIVANVKMERHMTGVSIIPGGSDMGSLLHALGACGCGRH